MRSAELRPVVGESSVRPGETRLVELRPVPDLPVVVLRGEIERDELPLMRETPVERVERETEGREETELREPPRLAPTEERPPE